MANPVVVTLPITPRHTPSLGLMLIPFVMDILGKQMGTTKKVLALNVSGAKLVGANVEPHVCGYLKTCEQIGIVPDIIWRDDQRENVYWISRFFRQLVNDGLIIKAERAIKCCPCRIVETLASADNFSDARKLYYWSGGVCLCKICQLPVQEEVDNVYLLRIPKSTVDFSVTPAFTGVEIANLAGRFAGSELLISRTRDSAIPLWTGREQIFLDPDFAWQLYLPILWQCDCQPSVMVGSQKSLFGCYLAILLLQILIKVRVDLVVPAYCQTINENEDAVISHFREWDRATIRLFLAAHVAYHIKDTRFDVSVLRLIKTLNPSKLGQRIVPAQTLPLGEALNRSSARCLRQLLMKARRSGVVDSLILELC